jgi:hypothetical protein
VTAGYEAVTLIFNVPAFAEDGLMVMVYVAVSTVGSVAGSKSKFAPLCRV